MFVVHGTRKFLDRVKGPARARVDRPTTALGDWYATVQFWKPQVALFVNEATLVPVLVPFAPAATVVERFRASAATVLGAHGLHYVFVEHEVAEMSEYQLAPTANRSVLGIMNEFARLAEADRLSNPTPDLLMLSLRLAETPCSPLRHSHGSPDRELAAFAASRLGCEPPSSPASRGVGSNIGESVAERTDTTKAR